MPSIRQLPTHVINQIAAGEVIERPGCVVKELMDNAIDAGAHKIDLDLEDAGKRRILLVDDGCGVPLQELPLAITSHATSKIQSMENLLRGVRTLGFRGEALASIASVSRMTITSRPENQESAGRLSNHEGTFGSPVEVGAPTGTAIEVEHLFHNVPARRKFLKSSRSEISHIKSLVGGLCLARSDLDVRVRHAGRSILHIPANRSLRDRIAHIHGHDLADRLIEFEGTGSCLTLHGLAASPDLSFSRRMLRIFVDGRPIQDRTIQAAVTEAYRDFLPPRRHPAVFLFLEMAPDSVDVNVHPRKTEVRFADNRAIFSAVRRALLDRLGGGERWSHRPQDGLTQRGSSWKTSSVRETPPSLFRAPGSSRHSTTSPQPGLGAKSFQHPAPSISSTPSESLALTLPEGEDMHSETCGPVAQFHDTYLIQQTSTGIEIIDQHAFHERILYAQFKETYDSSGMDGQILLVPETVDLDPKEIEALEQHPKAVASLGLTLEPFGPGTVLVRKAPQKLSPRDVRDLVQELGAGLSREGAPEQITATMDRILSTMACRAAVKAGDSLNSTSIRKLLALRDLAGHTDTCPHGRPTTVDLSLVDLEKLFGRR
ncbi:MAG: DNA mismatch repair endonuclease MutL [Planctomycetota bacterium]|nr:DNA mismatch repair endonuclease MutL [Planctomycetota bacterium]